MNISIFRYLKEIGYVDTIIDIRSTAVKKLLGIKSESNTNGTSGLNGDIKSTNESKRLKKTFVQFNDKERCFLDRLESFQILLKMLRMI